MRPAIFSPLQLLVGRLQENNTPLDQLSLGSQRLLVDLWPCYPRIDPASTSCQRQRLPNEALRMRHEPACDKTLFFIGLTAELNKIWPQGEGGGGGGW